MIDYKKIDYLNKKSISFKFSIKYLQNLTQNLTSRLEINLTKKKYLGTTIVTTKQRIMQSLLQLLNVT